jgi:ribosomal protein S18 acetylase RimI-like enzyme
MDERWQTLLGRSSSDLPDGTAVRMQWGGLTEMGQTTLIVTELDRRDFPTIRGWIDPNLFRRFRAPITDAQLEGLLTQWRDSRLSGMGLKAADDVGRARGFVHVVFEWNNDLGHIQQILVEPASRRHGVGYVLMRHTLRVCFEEHRLHRMQLFVEEDNAPAVAFYRKMGFHADGLMRDAWKIGDRYVSWYCLSMLQSEWKG